MQILQAPKQFRPSNVLDKHGLRAYQVVVVRLHQLGDNLPAIVARVFRGSVKKKAAGLRSGCKPHEEALPSQETVGLHLVLPQAMGPDSPNVFKATCRSPALWLDPHDDQPDGPRLLMELAPGWYETRQTATNLLLQVSDAAAAGIQAVKRVNENMDAEDKALFSDMSFGASDKGFSNMQAYMGIMKTLYHKVAGRPLTTQDGRLRTLKTSSGERPVVVAWLDFLVFFQKLQNSTYSNYSPFEMK